MGGVIKADHLAFVATAPEPTPITDEICRAFRAYAAEVERHPHAEFVVKVQNGKPMFIDVRIQHRC